MVLRRKLRGLELLSRVQTASPGTYMICGHASFALDRNPPSPQQALLYSELPCPVETKPNATSHSDWCPALHDRRRHPPRRSGRPPSGKASLQLLRALITRDAHFIWTSRRRGNHARIERALRPCSVDRCSFEGASPASPDSATVAVDRSVDALAMSRGRQWHLTIIYECQVCACPYYGSPIEIQ